MSTLGVNHAIGQANCAIVRQAVIEGHSTVAAVADMTGLSMTSASHHLRHNVWDGHLKRELVNNGHLYYPVGSNQ